MHIVDIAWTDPSTPTSVRPNLLLRAMVRTGFSPAKAGIVGACIAASAALGAPAVHASESIQTVPVTAPGTFNFLSFDESKGTLQSVELRHFIAANADLGICQDPDGCLLFADLSLVGTGAFSPDVDDTAEPIAELPNPGERGFFTLTLSNSTPIGDINPFIGTGSEEVQAVDLQFECTALGFEQDCDTTDFSGDLELRYVFTPNAVGTASVPGPVPALGAAAAFGYGRRLRKRIGRSRSLPVSSGIDR